MQTVLPYSNCLRKADHVKSAKNSFDGNSTAVSFVGLSTYLLKKSQYIY